MKKFLVMMMCVIMVVCFMPTVALAAENDAINTAEGLTQAIQNASENDVINLSGDIELTSQLNINKPVTINGNNHTITSTISQGTSGESAAGILITANANLKNLKVIGPNQNNPISWKSGFITVKVYGGEVTLDNVEFTRGSEALQVSGSGTQVTISGTQNYNGNVYNGIEVKQGATLIVGENTAFSNKNNSVVWINNGESGTVTDTNNVLDVISDKNSGNSFQYGYAVAKVDNEKFGSLTNAINAATGGRTVTLLKDVDLNATQNITNDVTIDLNGHNITGIGLRAFHVQKGKLTLTGAGIISSKDVEDSGYSVIRVGDNSVEADSNAGLEIGANVTISTDCCYGVSVFGSKTKETVVVNGKIKVNGAAAALSGNGNAGWGNTNITINPGAEVTATQDAGIYHPQSGVLTINGGTIVGTSAIECKAGETTVVVSGNPTITATGVVDDSAANNNGTSSRGYAVAVVENAAYAGGAKVTIKSGTYTGAIGIRQDNEVDEGKKGSIVISGGTFSTDVSAYVEDGKFEYAMRNGTYIVQGAEKPAFTTGNYWSDLVGKVYTEMYSAPYIPPTPTTPTDNVTNSGTSGTDNATTSADLSGSTSTSNGTTSSTVDKTTADKIVDKAVENKSEEIVIDATANSTTASNSTTTAQVTIPTETLGAIAEKTEADVTIKTDVAEVKMDNAAAAAVADQAEGDTVHIIAEKVAEEADKVELELKVVCSEGKVISNFNGGNIAVTVALPKAMAEKKVVCVYIDDNGHMSKVEGQKNADGTYTFVTGHFSSYAILAEEEADAAIAAQKEAIKNIKIKLTSKQVKTKAGKKAVKITWTAAAGDKVLDGVEVFRSTERYKGYGTEPFYTSTKGGNEGYYLNTKSLKKGTRYYYRVRGYVLVDGQKVYTDYSTKAWRTVK